MPISRDIVVFQTQLSDGIAGTENWFKGGGNGIIILAPASSVDLLKPLNLNFIEIVRDEYFILLSVNKNK